MEVHQPETQKIVRKVQLDFDAFEDTLSQGRADNNNEDDGDDYDLLPERIELLTQQGNSARLTLPKVEIYETEVGYKKIVNLTHEQTKQLL